MKFLQLTRSRANKLAVIRKAWPPRAAIALPLAIAILAVCGAMTGALPAAAATSAKSSAAKFAAAATPFQNKVLDAAMSRVPGGTRVSEDAVAWDHGHLVVGVTAPKGARDEQADAPGVTVGPGGTLTCSAGYFCAWGAPTFGGTCWVYMVGTVFEFDWAAYSGADCGSVGTWSWDNETGVRVWKEQSWSGETPLSGDSYTYTGGTPSGTNYCIDPSGGSNSEVSDETNGTIRTLGWIYVSNNMSAC